jgi:hypothetical protein
MVTLKKIEELLSSDKNRSSLLRRAYDGLLEIIKANPENTEVINNALNLIEKGLVLDKNSSNSLRRAYNCLSEIVKTNPKHADKVMELVQQGLFSKNNKYRNDEASSEAARECLIRIIKAKPKNTELVNNIRGLIEKEYSVQVKFTEK